MKRDPAARPALRANPWWIPRFLGRVPDLGDAQVRTLGVIALALLFENYDQATLSAALKQIAAGFGVPESDLAGMLGWVHLGSIPAFLLIPFADRIGRRRLFLVSLIGLSLATFASAFAPGVAAFVAMQMLSRTFMLTCSATAFVILTEEFPADHRGWGIGVLGALATAGHGLGLMLFAGIDWLPYGWRALYVVGLVPVLMLPMFRREVRETDRFSRFRRETAARGEAPGLMQGWWRPMRGLMSAFPGRAAAIGAAGALTSAAHSVCYSFAAYFVQTTHGWAPGQYTAMAVAAGLVGVIGHPWAGRMADRRGRRRVGFALLGGFPLLGLAFYHGPAWSLPLVWVPLIFALTGGDTILRALSTELFPTSHRGTASGWLKLCDSLGRAAGFFALAWVTPRGASNTPAISALVFASLLAGLIVLALPETGGRELEEISGEV